MNNIYWCQVLVITIKSTATKKQVAELMDKIEKWRGTEWDYDYEEAIKKEENFIDFHNYLDVDEQVLAEIWDYVFDDEFSYPITYRWTDEIEGGCNSCTQ